MSALQIRVLGGFEARPASGPALKLPSRKAEGVLAYLALSPGVPHSRERISSLFWSDRAEPQARGSLRQTLTALRKCLGGNGGEVLRVEGDKITLDPRIVEVDVALFERLLKEGTAEALERALELYRGDFLDGNGIRDAAFEDWLRGVRARLRSTAVRAFVKVLASESGMAAWDRVIVTAERLLALDPLQEAGHQALMRAYAAQGDRTLAIQQYEICRETLQRELGVLPESETETIYAEIADDTSPTSREAARHRDRASETHVSEGACVKPSIAVLPLDSLSASPEQGYFSDGFTEDIITGLSRFRNLTVIARHSSFIVGRERESLVDIGRKLGVQYVVEGSVRKIDSRIRVTAQLIEAATGRHLWAERYDRDLTDLFIVQDEIVGSLVGALAARVDDARLQEAKRTPPENLDAYDCWLRGMDCLGLLTAQGDAEARQFFRKALEIDPQFARAYSGLAMSHFYLCSALSYMPSGEDAVLKEEHRATSYARSAVALDDADHHTHRILGIMLLFQGDFEQARHHLERALALNPNDAETHAWMAWAHMAFGEPEAGIDAGKTAIRLNPFYPVWYSDFLSNAYFMARQYDKAIATMERAPDAMTDTRAWLTAAYAHSGDLGQARAQLEEFYKKGGARWTPESECNFRVLRVTTESDSDAMADWPGRVTLAYLHDHYRGYFRRQDDLEHFLDGLRKAGMQE